LGGAFKGGKARPQLWQKKGHGPRKAGGKKVFLPTGKMAPEKIKKDKKVPIFCHIGKN